MSYDASSSTLQARSPSGPRVREPVDRVDEAVNSLRRACKAGGYHELAEHVSVIRHLVRHGRFRE
ncbi:MAG: hypothetical protein ACPGVY_17575, partial [Mycobacterium sp.]